MHSIRSCQELFWEFKTGIDKCLNIWKSLSLATGSFSQNIMKCRLILGLILKTSFAAARASSVRPATL